MAISIYEPDDTIFATQAPVFLGTITMTLVIPIMMTMLSREQINYNNSSILEISIIIMIIMIVSNQPEVDMLLLFTSNHEFEF